MARRGYVDKRGNKRQYSMIPFVGLGILVVLLIVIIVGITSCAKGCSNKGDTNETKPQTTTTAKATESSFNMSIAGDYIIYSSIYKGANELAGGNGYNFKPMVKNLKQFTSKCDVNYYNQETTLGGTEMGLSDYPLFVSPQEAGDAMVDLGYNLVSTATNHSMDGGEEGILNSCKYWDKQRKEHNVYMMGTYDSQADRDAVNVLECNDIKYTMLDYTYGTNGIPVPDGKEYMVNVWPIDLEKAHF